jgi:hypothetical protein
MDFEPTAKLYCSFMDEIKQRVQVLGDILAIKYPLPRGVAAELCHLQLRFICELIALGCLVAHGDIQDVRKELEKQYHPREILKRLEGLHPSFYPVPGNQKTDPGTGAVLGLEIIKDGFLTKPELLSLYGMCGDVLHLGSLKSVLAESKTSWEPEKIAGWRDKIVRLLNHHQIQLFDSPDQLWVIMAGAGDNKVHFSLMHSTEASTPLKGVPRIQILPHKD